MRFKLTISAALCQGHVLHRVRINIDVSIDAEPSYIHTSYVHLELKNYDNSLCAFAQKVKHVLLTDMKKINQTNRKKPKNQSKKKISSALNRCSQRNLGAFYHQIPEKFHSGFLKQWMKDAYFWASVLLCPECG